MEANYETHRTAARGDFVICVHPDPEVLQEEHLPAGAEAALVCQDCADGLNDPERRASATGNLRPASEDGGLIDPAAIKRPGRPAPVPAPVQLDQAELVTGYALPPDAAGYVLKKEVLIPDVRAAAFAVAAFRPTKDECRVEAWCQTLFRIEQIIAWGPATLLRVSLGVPADPAVPAGMAGTPLVDQVIWEGRSSPEILLEGFAQRMSTAEVGVPIFLDFDQPAPPCCAVGVSVC